MGWLPAHPAKSTGHFWVILTWGSPVYHNLTINFLGLARRQFHICRIEMSSTPQGTREWERAQNIEEEGCRVFRLGSRESVNWLSPQESEESVQTDSFDSSVFYVEFEVFL